MFKSLRSRFIGFAVVLSVVTLLGTFVAQQKIEVTTSDVADNLSQRHQMHIITRQINVHVFDGYKALNAYLLDPSRTEYKHILYDTLKQARLFAVELDTHPWIQRS